MSLHHYLTRDLNHLKQIVSTLDDSQFVKSLNTLSGSSLGQHVRHIVEFYQALCARKDNGVVCYDDRKRDKLIETDRGHCLRVIESLMLDIQTIHPNEPVIVVANYDETAEVLVHHVSSGGREMGYVLEHSIHHQAMLKIGLSELGLRTGRNTGVAAATIRFNNYYS